MVYIVMMNNFYGTQFSNRNLYENDRVPKTDIRINAVLMALR